MNWVDSFRQLEATCDRAPSAHNTQPWLLRYDDDVVTVHWDPDRSLPDSDPTRRDLFLSLGAYVETCLIVAADAGLMIRADIDIHESQRRVARLVAARTPYATPFSRLAIERRQCVRGRYAPGRLTPATVNQLAVHGADLRQLRCRPLAEQLNAADRWLFGTPTVARELRQWLRLSPRHPRYLLDGLTDRALNLSRVEAIGLAAALAPRPYALGRRLGLPSLLATASRSLLRYDGSVLVLVGQASTPEALVHQGRALLRVWLALSEDGLAVHPLSQLLDCATTADQLNARLGLTRPDAALAVFRVGRPLHPAAASARRSNRLVTSPAPSPDIIHSGSDRRASGRC